MSSETRTQAREHRGLELLSATFGRYMQSWFAAHVPSTSDAGMAATRDAAETKYKKFAQHVGAEFAQGHRFIDDFPAEALGDGAAQKLTQTPLGN